MLHKENVRKRLKEMRQKEAEDAKLERELKKAEREAKKTFSKDMCDEHLAAHPFSTYVPSNDVSTVTREVTADGTTIETIQRGPSLKKKTSPPSSPSPPPPLVSPLHSASNAPPMPSEFSSRFPPPPSTYYNYSNYNYNAYYYYGYYNGPMMASYVAPAVPVSAPTELSVTTTPSTTTQQVALSSPTTVNEETNKINKEEAPLPGEWQTVDESETYSKYYRPASPECPPNEETNQSEIPSKKRKIGEENSSEESDIDFTGEKGEAQPAKYQRTNDSDPENENEASSETQPKDGDNREEQPIVWKKRQPNSTKRRPRAVI
jgi:hypothetical protein